MKKNNLIVSHFSFLFKFFRYFNSHIINKSIEAHGWDQDDFSIVFDFRDYQYELKRKNKFYSFQRTTKKEGNVVKI